MFETKYSVSILNSKWSIIKTNLNLRVIPRKGELLLFDEKYFSVLNVIHRINNKQEIFIIIEQIENDEKIN